jgi:hypothetical protein
MRSLRSLKDHVFSVTFAGTVGLIVVGTIALVGFLMVVIFYTSPSVVPNMPTGPTGPSGADGADGPTGPTGPTGESGITPGESTSYTGHWYGVWASNLSVTVYLSKTASGISSSCTLIITGPGTTTETTAAFAKLDPILPSVYIPVTTVSFAVGISEASTANTDGVLTIDNTGQVSLFNKGLSIFSGTGLLVVNPYSVSYVTAT